MDHLPSPNDSDLGQGESSHTTQQYDDDDIEAMIYADLQHHGEQEYFIGEGEDDYEFLSTIGEGEYVEDFYDTDPDYLLDTDDHIDEDDDYSTFLTTSVDEGLETPAKRIALSHGDNVSPLDGMRSVKRQRIQSIDQDLMQQQQPLDLLTGHTPTIDGDGRDLDSDDDDIHDDDSMVLLGEYPMHHHDHQQQTPDLSDDEGEGGSVNSNTDQSDIVTDSDDENSSSSSSLDGTGPADGETFHWFSQSALGHESFDTRDNMDEYTRSEDHDEDDDEDDYQDEDEDQDGNEHEHIISHGDHSHTQFTFSSQGYSSSNMTPSRLQPLQQQQRSFQHGISSSSSSPDSDSDSDIICLDDSSDDGPPTSAPASASALASGQGTMLPPQPHSRPSMNANMVDTDDAGNNSDDDDDDDGDAICLLSDSDSHDDDSTKHHEPHHDGLNEQTTTASPPQSSDHLSITPTESGKPTDGVYIPGASLQLFDITSFMAHSTTAIQRVKTNDHLTIRQINAILVPYKDQLIQDDGDDMNNHHVLSTTTTTTPIDNDEGRIDPLNHDMLSPNHFNYASDSIASLQDKFALLSQFAENQLRYLSTVFGDTQTYWVHAQVQWKRTKQQLSQDNQQLLRQIAIIRQEYFDLILPDNDDQVTHSRSNEGHSRKGAHPLGTTTTQGDINHGNGQSTSELSNLLVQLQSDLSSALQKTHLLQTERDQLEQENAKQSETIAALRAQIMSMHHSQLHQQQQQQQQQVVSDFDTMSDTTIPPISSLTAEQSDILTTGMSAANGACTHLDIHISPDDDAETTSTIGDVFRSIKLYKDKYAAAMEEILQISHEKRALERKVIELSTTIDEYEKHHIIDEVISNAFKPVDSTTGDDGDDNDNMITATINQDEQIQEEQQQQQQQTAEQEDDMDGGSLPPSPSSATTATAHADNISVSFIPTEILQELDSIQQAILQTESQIGLTTYSAGVLSLQRDQFDSDTSSVSSTKQHNTGPKSSQNRQQLRSLKSRFTCYQQLLALRKLYHTQLLYIKEQKDQLLHIPLLNEEIHSLNFSLSTEKKQNLDLLRENVSLKALAQKAELWQSIMMELLSSDAFKSAIDEHIPDKIAFTLPISTSTSSPGGESGTTMGATSSTDGMLHRTHSFNTDLVNTIDNGDSRTDVFSQSFHMSRHYPSTSTSTPGPKSVAGDIYSIAAESDDDDSGILDAQDMRINDILHINTPVRRSQSSQRALTPGVSRSSVARHRRITTAVQGNDTTTPQPPTITPFDASELIRKLIHRYESLSTRLTIAEEQVKTHDRDHESDDDDNNISDDESDRYEQHLTPHSPNGIRTPQYSATTPKQGQNIQKMIPLASLKKLTPAQRSLLGGVQLTALHSDDTSGMGQPHDLITPIKSGHPHSHSRTHTSSSSSQRKSHRESRGASSISRLQHDEYLRLQADVPRLTAQLEDLQAEYETMKAEYNMLKQQHETLQIELREMDTFAKSCLENESMLLMGDTFGDDNDDNMGDEQPTSVQTSGDDNITDSQQQQQQQQQQQKQQPLMERRLASSLHAHKIASLEDVIEALKSQLTDVTRLKYTISTLEHDKQQLNKQCEELQHELTNLRHTSGDAELKLLQHQGLVQSLRNELAEAQSAVHHHHEHDQQQHSSLSSSSSSSHHGGPSFNSNVVETDLMSSFSPIKNDYDDSKSSYTTTHTLAHRVNPHDVSLSGGSSDHDDDDEEGRQNDGNDEAMSSSELFTDHDIDDMGLLHLTPLRPNNRGKLTSSSTTKKGQRNSMIENNSLSSIADTKLIRELQQQLLIVQSERDELLSKNQKLQHEFSILQEEYEEVCREIEVLQPLASHVTDKEESERFTVLRYKLNPSDTRLMDILSDYKAKTTLLESKLHIIEQYILSSQDGQSKVDELYAPLLYGHTNDQEKNADGKYDHTGINGTNIADVLSNAVHSAKQKQQQQQDQQSKLSSLMDDEDDDNNNDIQSDRRQDIANTHEDPDTTPSQPNSMADGSKSQQPSQHDTSTVFSNPTTGTGDIFELKTQLATLRLINTELYAKNKEHLTTIDDIRSAFEMLRTEYARLYDTVCVAHKARDDAERAISKINDVYRKKLVEYMTMVSKCLGFAVKPLNTPPSPHPHQRTAVAAPTPVKVDSQGTTPPSQPPETWYSFQFTPNNREHSHKKKNKDKMASANITVMVSSAILHNNHPDIVPFLSSMEVQMNEQGAGHQPTRAAQPSSSSSSFLSTPSMKKTSSTIDHIDKSTQSKLLSPFFRLFVNNIDFTSQIAKFNLSSVTGTIEKQYGHLLEELLSTRNVSLFFSKLFLAAYKITSPPSSSRTASTLNQQDNQSIPIDA